MFAIGPTPLSYSDELTEKRVVCWPTMSVLVRDVVSVLNVSVSRRFLERLVSVLKIERLGLVSVLRVQRLGLESLKKWNVSVSSRSCDLTSCGHPWTTSTLTE